MHVLTKLGVPSKTCLHPPSEHLTPFCAFPWHCCPDSMVWTLSLEHEIWDLVLSWTGVSNWHPRPMRSHSSHILGDPIPRLVWCVRPQVETAEAWTSYIRFSGKLLSSISKLSPRHVIILCTSRLNWVVFPFCGLSCSWWNIHHLFNLFMLLPLGPDMLPLSYHSWS